MFKAWRLVKHYRLVYAQFCCCRPSLVAYSWCFFQNADREVLLIVSMQVGVSTFILIEPDIVIFDPISIDHVESWGVANLHGWDSPLALLHIGSSFFLLIQFVISELFNNSDVTALLPMIVIFFLSGHLLGGHSPLSYTARSALHVI